MEYPAQRSCHVEWRNRKSKGELLNNFLVEIGADICTHRYKEDEVRQGHVLNDAEDKVVQDVKMKNGMLK
ncbi:unnamed protein product [Didymodactylos carnosus]|uniref:Uncharacterized protein n=1 Tax=Didymodactylos carnosus TaxID=1234261 RepID=A0A815EUQ8_9BILA|nr:unnamed protein product [Didymodactylos carnosus]CAF4155554.1 unnamed protein product [Didymodactylos carnosus]